MKSKILVSYYEIYKFVELFGMKPIYIKFFDFLVNLVQYSSIILEL